MKRIIYTLALLLLVACGTHEDQKILNATDSLMAERPDSALKLLDGMKAVGQMGEEGVMHYAWNRAMAHYRLGQSLAEDTLTLDAVRYYERRQKVKGAEGSLLAAWYLHWTNRDDEALRELDRAMRNGLKGCTASEWAELAGMKYQILYQRNDYAAAERFLRDYLAHKPIPDEAVRGKLLYALATVLALQDSPDADRTFEESIRLAADKATAAECMRNYSAALSEKGEYAKSNRLLYAYARLSPETAGYSAIQLAMASNYLNLHRMDSVRICLAKAVRSEHGLEAHGQGNISRRANLEQLRAVLNFSEGRPVSSLAFSRYCDSVTTAMIEKENTSARRLETRNRLQAANYELHQSRLRLAIGILLLVFVIVGGGSLAFSLYRRKYRRLAEAEDRIITLTRMLHDAGQMRAGKTHAEDGNTPDHDFFKKILLQQLGIIKLVAATPTSQNQALLKRIAGIGGGEIPTHDLLVWSDLYPIVDRLYHDFYSRLTARFGNRLTEKEIQICCLLRAGFSTKEIGVVTQQSNATIYVRKTSIRKKTGMAEGEDIVAFVEGL